MVVILGEGLSGTSKREQAWREWHGRAVPSDQLWFVSPSDSLNNQARIDALSADLAPLAPKLLIVDTQATVFPDVDENNSLDAGKMVALLRRMQQRTGNPTLLVLHHTPRSDPGRERGSTVFRGAADAMFGVTREGASGVRLTVLKQKDAEPMEPLAFNLEAVDLADGSSLVPVFGGTTAVAPEATRWADPIIATLQSAELPTGKLWAACGGTGDKPSRAFNDTLAALKDAARIEKQGGQKSPWRLTAWERTRTGVPEAA